MTGGVPATALPAYLAMPSGGSGRPGSDIRERLAEALGGEREITTGLARELAEWVALDFQESSLTLLRTRCRGAVLLMHAALVGLARGASQDAFAYAAVRKVNGRPLIQCELIAARLSSIATHEVIADLQFCRLCDLPATPGGEEECDMTQRELQRAALATVVESAHVRGGHGFVQLEDPGRRVETAHAVLAHLATPWVC